MTHFVIPTSASSSPGTFTKVVAIDISGFTGEGDYISFSLPEFPRTKLEISKTLVDFTSHPEGNFSVGPTDSIAFSAASPALPGVAEDTEMRLPISLLKTIDKGALTGIRFRLYAKEKCTFRCLSIRACSANWKYAPLDIDTLWDRAHRPPSVNGKAAPTTTFPEAEGKSFPILFRSNDLSGITDPMPVNIDAGAVFTTGSFEQAKEGSFNEIGLFFRDIPIDDQTMVELNTFKQAELDGKGKQPDFGTALYTTRTQKQLDVDDQGEIDNSTQFVLEREPDLTEHSWLEVRLRWNATQATNELTVHNADGIGYAFTGMEIKPISSKNQDAGHYILLVSLIGSSCRVKIFPVDQVGNIGETAVFDSDTIIDTNLFKRRKGRFGWWAKFSDGDAYLENVKTRGVNYGEMISKEFLSITPIKGVSLFAGSTEDVRLAKTIYPTNSELTSLTLDPSASATGHAFKVSPTPLKSLQGITTNTFVIDDPNDLQISFNLKFPSSDIPGGNLNVYLLGPNEQITNLNLSSYTKETWSHVKAEIPKGTLFQTGSYQLVLMQPLPVSTDPWWIENLAVNTSSVKWAARSHANEPWGDPEERWQNAGFTLNSEQGGIVFEEIGNGLQVRAQVRRQEGEIHDYKAVPQYATLGRIV